MALRLMVKTCYFKSVNKIRYIHITPVAFKLTQFFLSDIGEGIKEVTIRDWFVNVGDKVSQFDNICLVESDKASVNITSRYDGIVKKIYYRTGDIALVGKPLVDIDTDESESHDVDVKNESLDINTKPKPDDIIPDNRAITKKLATPAVRRIASEFNVSLKEIQGTGKDGRVMKEDILNFLNRNPEKTEKPIRTDEDNVVPITGIRKIMFKTMTESSTIPAFGYYDEINVTKLVDFRNEIKEIAKKNGITFTYMPFFIKAMSKCIEKFPELNSSIDDNCENIIIKSSHNIGIAVDTPKGLVVPNIKNVQNLSVGEINHKLNQLTEKGRNNQLTIEDLSNGTISISNVGAIGGTYAVPLINRKEVCILGVGKFRAVPMFNSKDEIIKGHSCFLSWTADHRIIDGATMARFSNMFKEYLENPHNFLIRL